MRIDGRELNVGWMDWSLGWFYRGKVGGFGLFLCIRIGSFGFSIDYVDVIFSRMSNHGGANSGVNKVVPIRKSLIWNHLKHSLGSSIKESTCEATKPD